MDAVHALVVDDEAIARKVTTDMLVAMDYEVVSAADGKEGLERFDHGDFDLVVTDINMPRMDGLELVRRITEKDLEAACLVMTVRSDQESAIEAMRCGAYGFLHKPFDQSQLSESVNKARRLRDRVALARRLESELQRSQSERAALEERFIDTEKLSALGQIAPRIAHEIKTPLQTLSGHTELSLHWLRHQGAEAIDEVVQYLEVMLPAVQRIEGLVQQMFELGRPLEPRVSEVDVAHQISGILDELRSAGITKHCDVEESYDHDLAFVHAEAEQLRQVFQNLILNAAQAMEGRTPRRLRVAVVTEDEGRLRISIADTGCGIPQEKLEKIWLPFFTTKSDGKGTGLGLAIVRSVIERHGGTIEVHSEPDMGTEFVVRLPAQAIKEEAR